jgi:exodeoxyribonuclease V alpha subunit
MMQRIRLALLAFSALSRAVIRCRAKAVRRGANEHAALPAAAESLLKVLDRALKEGHTCLTRESLTGRARACGEGRAVSAAEITLVLRQLEGLRRVRLTDSDVALAECAAAEETIAHSLKRVGRRLRPLNPDKLTQWVTEADARLSDEQRAAVRLLASSPVAVLTGGPGTGKTSTVKALLAVCRRAGYRVKLTAPTGRAAQRLGEATGEPAQTLHRLLQSEGGNRRTIRDLISPAKVVIVVDEASMLDVFLAGRLVGVCSPRTRLILVGDAHQLPPVGPGQVLGDLIESGQIPVAELTAGFRQREGSRIAAAAGEVKEGRVPDLPPPGREQGDCYFIAAETVPEIQALVVKAATSSLPARCDADPYQSIQVLTPTHKGALGTAALNERIRRALARRGGERREAARPPDHPFLPGDRVLHTRNNYRLGVFNGECGGVRAVTRESVTVGYGGRTVTYSGAALDELAHGFAISTHKGQGSEYPFVIIPLHESHGAMLSRELLYTALTRARQMAVVIGSRRALALAVSNTAAGRRTGLGKMLGRQAGERGRTPGRVADVLRACLKGV